MSTIRQLCPSCNRMLELPAGAAGRLAKCPACDATFTVAAAAEEVAANGAVGGEALEGAGATEGSTPPADPASASAQPNQLGSDYQDSALPPYSTPQTGEAAGAEPTDAAHAAASPFSVPLASGTPTGLGPGARPVPPQMNPYEPTYAQDPVAAIGELQVVPRTIEDIFSPTLSIFGARWGVLVLAFVVVLAASFAAFVVPILMLAAIADAGGDVVAGIGLLIVVPALLLFGCYISVGLARNAIAVARNTPSPMMELLPPFGLVVRFLVGAVVMSVGVGLVIALFAGIIGALVAVGGNQGLAGILGGLGVVAGMGLAMVAYWVLWAWMFIVSDGKGTALGSIEAAYTLTMHNKVTSVLLVVIATVLSTAGTSACYVGLLVTQPLTNLMFAVAYLLMTNQRIDDPRMRRQSYQGPPPPTQPTF